MYKDSPDTPPEVVVEDDSKLSKKALSKFLGFLILKGLKLPSIAQDHINLFARIAVDYSFTCKIPISI